MSSIIKKTSYTDIAAFAAVVVVAYWLVRDMSSPKTEGFDQETIMAKSMTAISNGATKAVASSASAVKSIMGYEEEPLAPVNYSKEISKTGSGCDTLKFVSTNLLPKADVNLDDTFAEFSPANLEGQNFLDSRNFTIGMQSQVLRNANLQLRSEPQIPKETTCAWNQSTITGETRRQMDIGAPVG